MIRNWPCCRPFSIAHCMRLILLRLKNSTEQLPTFWLRTCNCWKARLSTHGFKAKPSLSTSFKNHFAIWLWDSEVLHPGTRFDSVIKPKLAEASSYSATTILWTSSCSDLYSSLTVHFVTSDWNLQSLCLGRVYLPDSHTGQNIGEAVSDILSNWELSQDKLVATTYYEKWLKCCSSLLNPTVAAC